MAIVVFPNRLVPAADDDDDKWGEESALDPRSFFLFLALDGLLPVPGRPVPLRLAPCCISGAAQGWLGDAAGDAGQSNRVVHTSAYE